MLIWSTCVAFLNPMPLRFQMSSTTSNQNQRTFFPIWRNIDSKKFLNLEFYNEKNFGVAHFSFIMFLLEFFINILLLFLNVIKTIPIIFLTCLFHYHNRIQWFTDNQSFMIIEESKKSWGFIMPTFSYRCSSCDKSFDRFLKIRRKWSTNFEAMSILRRTDSQSNYNFCNWYCWSLFYRKVSSHWWMEKHFKRN